MLADKGRDTRAIHGWLDHWSMTGNAVHTPGAEPVQRRLAGEIQ
jgi:hypothetical protein